HAGIERAYQNARAQYFFRSMLTKLETYIHTCDSCHRNKPHQHQRYGELKWIYAPTQPWSLINLDFIVKLPEAVYPGHDFLADSVCNAHCKSTRLARMIIGREDWDAQRWAEEF
ncbi:hypothetical protein BJ508DRAFT_186556, partial [Ascobolus immersus RN42]